MNRKLSTAVITAALLVTLLLTQTALAYDTTYQYVTMSVGQSQTFYVTNGIYSLVYDSSKLSVTYTQGGTSFQVKALSAASPTTISLLSYRYSGNQELVNTVYNVTVSSPYSNSMSLTSGATQAYNTSYYNGLSITSYPNSNIATLNINNGFIYVTGVSTGTTTFSGTYVPTNTYATTSFTVQVTVNGGGNMSGTTTIKLGEPIYSDTSYTSASVTSSNTAICTVVYTGSKLLLTPVSIGTAYISGTVVPINGYSQSIGFTVNVTAGNTSSTTVAIGERKYSDVTYASPTVTSSAPSICSAWFDTASQKVVFNGIAAGSSTITIAPVSGASTIVYVTVTGSSAPSILSQSVSLKSGSTASVSGVYTSCSGFTYSNSAVATATYSNNTITVRGLNPGTTTITTTVTPSGSSIQSTLTITVTVTMSISEITDITTNADTITVGTLTSGIYLGQTKYYDVSVGRKYALNSVRLNGQALAGTERSRLVWASSDPDVVAVSKTGTFYTKSRGSANIIALTSTGTYTNYITVTVS